MKNLFSRHDARNLIRLEAGNCQLPDANSSSQNGMVKTTRLDFAAEVTVVVKFEIQTLNTSLRAS
jgi:hypothetical protein